MHAESYFELHKHEIHIMDPQFLAVDMVIAFDAFLEMKLETSTDEVLLMNISFAKLVTQYKMFKEAVTLGDSIVVEKIYNDYLPIFVCLGKHNYYNIMLDQTEEYYNRIPYKILQFIREK